MNMYEEGLPETAVILPAFNRELEIGTIVLIAKQYADRVIVVNNGSSDQCSEVAEFAGAEVVQDFTGTNKNFSLKKKVLKLQKVPIFWSQWIWMFVEIRN